MSSAKINNEYFNRNPMKLLQLKIIVATQDTITHENLKKNEPLLDQILQKLEICPPTYYTRRQLLQYLSEATLKELRTVPMWKKYHSVALALYCGRINYCILQPCSNFAASCYARALWCSLTNETPPIRISNMIMGDLCSQGFREAMVNLEPFFPAVWTEQVVEEIKQLVIQHYRNRHRSGRDPYNGELVPTIARISKRYASCYRKVEKYKGRFVNMIRSARSDKHRLKKYIMGFRQDKPDVISESDEDEEETKEKANSKNKASSRSTKDVPESSSAKTSETTTSEPTSSSVPSSSSASSPPTSSSLPFIDSPHRTPPLPDSSAACTSNASTTSSEKRQPMNSSPISMPNLSSKPSEADSCALGSTPTSSIARPMPRLICSPNKPRREVDSEDDGDDEEEEEDDKNEKTDDVKEEEEEEEEEEDDKKEKTVDVKEEEDESKSQSDSDSESKSSQDEDDEEESMIYTSRRRRRRIVSTEVDSSNSDSESETDSIKKEKEDKKKTIVKQEIIENAPTKSSDAVEETPMEIVNVKMEVKEENESDKENNENGREKPPVMDGEIIVISESDDEDVIFVRKYNKNDEPPTMISDGEDDRPIDLTLEEEDFGKQIITRAMKRRKSILNKSQDGDKRQKVDLC